MRRFCRVQCACGAVRVVEVARPAPCTCTRPRFTQPKFNPDLPFDFDRRVQRFVEEYGPFTLEETAALLGLDLDAAQAIEQEALSKLLPWMMEYR